VNAKELSALATHVRALTGLASVNMDIDPAAALVWDKLPEPEEGKPDIVRQALEAADWFERICTLDPQARRYQKWYGKVRERLVKAFKDEDELPPEGPDNQAVGGAGVPGNLPDAA